MKLYFFYTSPPVTNPQYSGSCFFWYTKGLLSYKGINSIVTIEKIFIERQIFESFSTDYGQLLTDYPYEVVNENAQSAKHSSGKTAFFASNDTIVYLMRKLILNIPHSELFTKKGEGAKVNAKKIGIESQEISYQIPDFSSFDLLVMGNDWGLIEQKVNYDYIHNSLNTICIQESVIDFNIVDQRMLHCSIPVFQGIVTLKNVALEGKVCAVIGNPRYEELTQSALPSANKVLINVNFTYGIFEEAREQWLLDILGECKHLDLDYLISQHPRDSSDLSAYNLVKTNASTVHDVLESCSFLITRFSSLIHESLSLGRPVIYYNPHGEKLFYDFEADSCCLFAASNKEELLGAMKKIIGTDQQTISSAIDQYLDRHLGVTRTGRASNFIEEFINCVRGYQILKKVSILKLTILRLKLVKRIVLRQKS